MHRYLEPSTYIDFENPDIASIAKELAAGAASELELVERCFSFVRDEIKHSVDYKLNPVTCKASDVLKHRTGYCFAKSHLLAALLRANGIPAGLCYQRLSFGSGYGLHGLNAVFLKDFGWYRIDARGNKAGIDAQFSPPREQLAFLAKGEGARDLPEIWAAPLPVVVEALERYETYEEVLANLPDVEVTVAVRAD